MIFPIKMRLLMLTSTFYFVKNHESPMTYQQNPSKTQVKYVKSIYKHNIKHY